MVLLQCIDLILRGVSLTLSQTHPICTTQGRLNNIKKGNISQHNAMQSSSITNYSLQNNHKGSQFLLSYLKHQSGFHMDIERGFPCYNHSFCSYWLLKVCFQCKRWRPKSRVCQNSHFVQKCT